MGSKSTASTTHGKKAKITIINYKGRSISLTILQFNLYSILTNGNKYSSVELMRELHISDPRSEIRYLRKYGIEVSDEWHIHPELGTRYKRYYIALSHND